MDGDDTPPQGSPTGAQEWDAMTAAAQVGVMLAYFEHARRTGKGVDSYEFPTSYHDWWQAGFDVLAAIEEELRQDVKPPEVDPLARVKKKRSQELTYDQHVIRERLAQIENLKATLNAIEHMVVGHGRLVGMSWRLLGSCLGISGQAAMQRFKPTMTGDEIHELIKERQAQVQRDLDRALAREAGIG